MTKGEIRKLRKAATMAGGDWRGVTIEMGENGQLELVRSRTRREEAKHQDAMDKWAKRNWESEGRDDF